MAQFKETPIRRTIRRKELREIIPLADSTIYEMEQRGERVSNVTYTAPTETGEAESVAFQK